MFTTTTTLRVLAASMLLACVACSSGGGDGVASATTTPRSAADTTAVIPTTAAPSTVAPSTVAPSTVAPSTVAPTSTLPPLQSGTYTIDVNGTQREYRLFVPDNLCCGPRPLVLAFHGWGPGESASDMETYSMLDDMATQKRFVVAYPQGTVTADSAGMPFWDVGYDIQKERVDDIGFARALQAFLVERLSLDAERVFATGFSTGADFVYRLACSGQAWLAAIAPVAGSMMLEMQRTCEHGPISVISIAGTADSQNLWEGDPENTSGFGAYSSQDGNMEFWANENNLTERRVITITKADLGSCGGADFWIPSRLEWWHPLGRVKVEFVTYEGMPHVWPGWCAASRISQFFMSHRRAG